MLWDLLLYCQRYIVIFSLAIPAEIVTFFISKVNFSINSYSILIFYCSAVVTVLFNLLLEIVSLVSHSFLSLCLFLLPLCLCYLHNLCVKLATFFWLYLPQAPVIALYLYLHFYPYLQLNLPAYVSA